MKILDCVSRADLIRCIGNGLGDGKLWSHLFGYSSAEKSLNSAKQIVDESIRLSAVSKISNFTAFAEIQISTQEKKASFVYIKSYELFKKKVKKEKRIIPLSVKDVTSKSSISIPPPLLPRARLNPIISSAVSYLKRSEELDFPKVIKAISNFKQVFPLPWKKLVRSAQRIIVIADRRSHQRAFLIDQNSLIKSIKKQYGKEIVRLIFIDDCVPLSRSIKKIYTFSSVNSAVLLLSDCGCLENRETEMKFWLKTGMLLREKGLKISALAPCPQNRIPAKLQSVWNILVWDRGTRLSKKSNIPLKDIQPVRTIIDKSYENAENAKKLLSLLSPCTYVDGAIIRKLRYKLGSRFCDIGTEADVWNHPGVRSDPLGFTIKSDLKEQLKSGFDNYSAALTFSIIDFLQEQQGRLPPLVVAEQMLLLSTISKKYADVFSSRHIKIYERVLEYLKQSDDSLGIKKSLIDWFNRYKIERAPTDVWIHPVLSALWIITDCYSTGNNNQKIPEKFNPEALSLLTNSSSEENDFFIYQHGIKALFFPVMEDFKHFPDMSHRGIYGVAIGKIKTEDKKVVITESCAGTTIRKKQIDLLNLEEAIYNIVSIESKFEKITLDKMKKPVWVQEINRSNEGLVAYYKNNKDNLKKCIWFNPGMYDVRDHASKENVIRDYHIIKKGFWWDYEEYAQFKDDGFCFTKPSWASCCGVDEFGFWAEITFKNVTQRMRWIPPGSFLMGSPINEIGHCDDEIQHEVTLTHSFWLADTACTQEFWEAVMGENPSEFNDNLQNPVENVSWDMICGVGGFLSKLNKEIPTINPILPSEAQWEYACRAGTTTAFWRDKTIPNVSENIGKNHIISNRKKEKKSIKTIVAKSLIPNPWGLWQMNCNVLEWCNDRYGTYLTDVIVNPTGPLDGETHVLRGGCWSFDESFLRSAFRWYGTPSHKHGFLLKSFKNTLPKIGININNANHSKALKRIRQFAALHGFITIEHIKEIVPEFQMQGLERVQQLCALENIEIKGISHNYCIFGFRFAIDFLENSMLNMPIKFHSMVSRSQLMKQIFEILPEVARTIATTLILGECGTGKEVIARSIHELSERKQKPFVAINCSALPDTLLESELFGYKAGAFIDAKKDKPGKFALAEGGTLFLDEIGDLSLTMQVKLLRVFQERDYEPLGGTVPVKANVRVIAATNRNLAEMVRNGQFMEDLYYRISVVMIKMPPLRERRCDIPLLVDHFIGQFNARYNKQISGIDENALFLLLQHEFPGNIRELENIIEHAFIFCKSGQIRIEHLPGVMADKTKDSEHAVEQLEKVEESMVKNVKIKRRSRKK
jgi:formylglycine-generating enzyme required for sulfatase activity